jgi:hypothetical protein
MGATPTASHNRESRPNRSDAAKTNAPAATSDAAPTAMRAVNAQRCHLTPRIMGSPIRPVQGDVRSPALWPSPPAGGGSFPRHPVGRVS